MLKNRSLQVKMVKDEAQEYVDVDEAQVFAEKVACVASYGRDAVILVGKVVIAYIVADTIRQVAVEHAKK